MVLKFIIHQFLKRMGIKRKNREHIGPIKLQESPIQNLGVVLLRDQQTYLSLHLGVVEGLEQKNVFNGCLMVLNLVDVFES